MITLRLAGVQLRYVNKAFWRNPASAFFTFAFPLIFLVIFTALLGHYTIHLGSRTINTSTYYVASKRAHGTPLPGASFLGGRVLHAVLVAVLLVAITAAFGRIVYSADIPTGVHLLEFIVALLVGAAAFCALGLAATSLIPNSDAAAPIVNAVILPLEFLSGIFIAFDNTTPAWILWVARVFPIRHFVLSMQAAFLGAPFSWTDVLVVAAWGVAGMLLAIRFFSWEPRQG